jgi:hypothetical protein
MYRTLLYFPTQKFTKQVSGYVGQQDGKNGRPTQWNRGPLKLPKCFLYLYDSKGNVTPKSVEELPQKTMGIDCSDDQTET